MKNILAILFVGLFMNLSQASVELMSYEEVDTSVEVLSLDSIEAMMSEKTNACYAYTYCSNGRLIQCQTWGQGCTFYSQQGVYVACTGRNQWGQWVNTQARCF
jgi:hypothetical protein